MYIYTTQCILLYFFSFFLYISDAYQHVKDNLIELNGKAGVDETDLVFLRGLLDSPAVTQLIKVRKDTFH